jgi:hypothetical protein
MGIPGALEFFVNETENYLMKNDSLQHIGWLTWFPNGHLLAGFQPLNPFSDLPWLPF